MNLNAEFSDALGLPKGTTKAVLTLEVGKIPQLDITAFLTGSSGEFVLTPDFQEIRRIEFSYRLVPFGERS